MMNKGGLINVKIHSESLVNDDILDAVHQLGFNELQVMDQSLVENASYTQDHGSFKLQSQSEVEKGVNSTSVTSSPSMDGHPPTLTPLESIYARRNNPHPTTNLQTLMHILKGNIGTGILAIPQAFMYSGLAIGTVGILLIGFICIHCMHILVKCAQALYVRERVTTLDYMDVADISFKTGPLKLQRFHKFIRTLTIIFLCITQFGFCCVYLLFMATNLKYVFDYLLHTSIPYQAYMAMVLPLLILFTFVRTLKALSYASTMANILQSASFCILFYLIIQDLPSIYSRRALATWHKLPLWFGVAIYSFEGISLVLPLENKMKTPQAFGGWNGVLNTGMTIVACMYAAVGFYGYLKYGDDIQSSITTNLGLTPLGIAVCMTYTISIFLSYLIQFYVPIEIIWPLVKSRLSSALQQRDILVGNIFRATLVLALFGLTATTTDLGSLISLVGAVSGSYLTVILPPILEMITFWDHGITKLTITKDIFIFLFGFIGFVTGTYTSLMEIITKH